MKNFRLNSVVWAVSMIAVGGVFVGCGKDEVKDAIKDQTQNQDSGQNSGEKKDEKKDEKQGEKKPSDTPAPSAGNSDSDRLKFCESIDMSVLYPAGIFRQYKVTTAMSLQPRPTVTTQSTEVISSNRDEAVVKEITGRNERTETYKRETYVNACKQMGGVPNPGGNPVDSSKVTVLETRLETIRVTAGEFVNADFKKTRIEIEAQGRTLVTLQSEWKSTRLGTNESYNSVKSISEVEMGQGMTSTTTKELTQFRN